MSIRENILKMPAWKALVCSILLMFSLGIVIEEILAHSVFQMFDRIILKMENDKTADLSDMDDIGKSEQQEYCKKYQWLIEEKAVLIKRISEEKKSPDMDYMTMQIHEKEINFAIEHHQFNLTKCMNTLKDK